MKRRLRGFTIPELVVVIVGIGILASIVMLGLNGFISSSRDRVRDQDTKQWVSTFDLYRSRYIVYPVMPASSTSPAIFCLGDFSASPYNGKCGTYTSSNATQYDQNTSAQTTSLATITKLGQYPKNSAPEISQSGAKGIGPFAYISQDADSGTINVTAYFLNYFQQACPADYANISTNATLNMTFAPYKAGLGSTNICFIKNQFTYNPS